MHPTQRDIVTRFGTGWNARPLFYNDHRALRFELGIGDHRFAYLLHALNRGVSILATAFRDAQSVHATLSIMPQPGEAFQPLIRIYRDTQSLAMPRPSRSQSFSSASTDESELEWLHFVIPLDPEHLLPSLFSQVAPDVRVTPSLAAVLRIFSLDLGILAHPYDSRGMDVAGPNTDRLAELARTHRDKLLDYDLDEMKRRYPDALS
jgi:hypothetical protein